MARAGTILEMAPLRITVLLAVSNATFSIGEGLLHGRDHGVEILWRQGLGNVDCDRDVGLEFGALLGRVAGDQEELAP